LARNHRITIAVKRKSRFSEARKNQLPGRVNPCW
jgi:hypothetical protein